MAWSSSHQPLSWHRSLLVLGGNWFYFLTISVGIHGQHTALPWATPAAYCLLRKLNHKRTFSSLADLCKSLEEFLDLRCHASDLFWVPRARIGRIHSGPYLDSREKSSQQGNVDMAYHTNPALFSICRATWNFSLISDNALQKKSKLMKLHTLPLHASYPNGNRSTCIRYGFNPKGTSKEALLETPPSQSC